MYVAQDVTTGKDYALKVSILCLSFIMLYQIYLCACQNLGRVKRADVKVYGIKRKEEERRNIPRMLYITLNYRKRETFLR